VISRVGTVCYCLEVGVGFGNVEVPCLVYWGFSKASKILLGGWGVFTI